MQGSSYSADLFARVIDFHLRGLQARWSDQYPKWKDVMALPHFLLYADDIMLFAMDPPELQAKFRDLTDTLSAIGLFVNPAKCSVLNVGGVTPGICVFSLARQRPSALLGCSAWPQQHSRSGPYAPATQNDEFLLCHQAATRQGRHAAQGQGRSFRFLYRLEVAVVWVCDLAHGQVHEEH